MRPFPILFLSVVSMAFASVGADFSQHAYFSRAAGKWTGEGELTSSEGETSRIREEWKGKVEDDGSFKIEGTREWNDETFEFRWVFFHNETTDLYEAEYWQTGMEEELRLEVSVTDNRIELKAPFGDSGGELRIINEFVNGNIEGNVEIANDQGQVLLGGQLIHTKAE